MSDLIKRDDALIPLNKRVQIYQPEQELTFGWLHELTGYSSVMPQYFAILDDGTEFDLRGYNYVVVDEVNYE